MNYSEYTQPTKSFVHIPQLYGLIIIIIIITIGSFTSNLHSNLQQIPGNHTIQLLAKAALL